MILKMNQNQKGRLRKFEDEGYVHFLNYNDGFTGDYPAQNSSNCVLLNVQIRVHSLYLNFLKISAVQLKSFFL
jgi:hypothetical protein